jgi:intergrase/recombinase
MDMRYCRKLHGSWLHRHGVTAEAIDFLHGRTSPSVFSRHYLTPDNSLRTRVLEAVEKLHTQLLSASRGEYDR